MSLHQSVVTVPVESCTVDTHEQLMVPSTPLILFGRRPVITEELRRQQQGCSTELKGENITICLADIMRNTRFFVNKKERFGPSGNTILCVSLELLN